MTICDVENETIEFYKDKVCVSFVNKDYAKNGVTKMVKAFEDYDQAIAFVEMKKKKELIAAFLILHCFLKRESLLGLILTKTRYYQQQGETNGI